jgi:hypothetical protein
MNVLRKSRYYYSLLLPYSYRQVANPGSRLVERHRMPRARLCLHSIPTHTSTVAHFNISTTKDTRHQHPVMGMQQFDWLRESR